MLTLFIATISFTFLYYIGNQILANSLDIKAEDRWKCSFTLLEIFSSFAIGYCVLGYVTFIIFQSLLKKNQVRLSDIIALVVAFFIVAIAITFFGSGINIADPFDTRFIIVIIIVGYITAIVQKKVFKKFINHYT
ncbi:hypothetical protein [Ferruginibacter sp. SUN106]|uniref:hypothetical protein n=1 Tax=Ferruginibacter sp. SUN106 TaxID=2978348 RepID=UPI003D35CE64